MVAFVGAYAFAQGLTQDAGYATGILPTMVLAGLGFMLTFGPLNMAATKGIADEEQGLASGLLFTSLQFGGAVALAIATAAMDAGNQASAYAAGSAGAQLDGFHPALIVSIVVAVAGLAIAVSGLVPEFRTSLARFRQAWRSAYASAGERG